MNILKFNKIKGFTLVEMLVVVTVLSLLGVLILTIFTRSLRGSNKSQVISQIKQNGQAVLEMMDKNIRGADNVVCVSSPLPTSLVVVKNGIYLRYRFISSSPTANGSIQQDNPGRGPAETDTDFVNRVCPTADPMVNPVILTDTNPLSGISVENGSFSQDKSAGFKDQVTVKFDLKAGISQPLAIAGQIDSVNFQTTVQLR